MTMIYAMLSASEKPACLSFRTREHIQPAIEMFDMASGGEGSFLKKPSVIFGAARLYPRFGSARKTWKS